MLEHICQHIRNYFISEVIQDTYTIADGTISPAVSLHDGQRFWIRGSAMNDGVYTYHPYGITNDDDDEVALFQNETFKGTVSPMRVPKDIVTLAHDITDWLGRFGDVINSPYDSENVIGVYSYKLKAGGGTYGSGSISWEKQFAERMNRWRKVSI